MACLAAASQCCLCLKMPHPQPVCLALPCMPPCRQFYKCPVESCNFFKWADEVGAAGAAAAGYGSPAGKRQAIGYGGGPQVSLAAAVLDNSHGNRRARGHLQCASPQMGAGLVHACDYLLPHLCRPAVRVDTRLAMGMAAAAAGGRPPCPAPTPTCRQQWTPGLCVTETTTPATSAYNDAHYSAPVWQGLGASGLAAAAAGQGREAQKCSSWVADGYKGPSPELLSTPSCCCCCPCRCNQVGHWSSQCPNVGAGGDAAGVSGGIGGGGGGGAKTGSCFKVGSVWLS